MSDNDEFLEFKWHDGRKKMIVRLGEKYALMPLKEAERIAYKLLGYCRGIKMQIELKEFVDELVRRKKAKEDTGPIMKELEEKLNEPSKAPTDPPEED